ncbi:peptide transporter family 1 [Phlebotomus argentipes]|uniref:peptide transporter family 1 n=1 Tax=Phlebotomus argentipes TaxID=94469 RepID=UPI002892C24F|nr:peptide transporter family 1 [Phlebotomus argentipes]
MAKDPKNDDTTANDNSTADTVEANDEEGQVKKYKYPKQIGFIILNELCERFNYYGMRTVLVLYLTRQLFFDQDTATVIYHSFTSAVYFLTVVGAIIADSWLGKYRTILYLSIVYVTGSILMSVGAIPTLNLNATAITIVGLFLIAFGSGGIKPCVTALGADQFKLPEQLKAMATYFSLFYFSINTGSMISTLVTPILRQDVQCFEQDTCFSLAFGVPAILMFTSILIFVAGKFLYVLKPPAGNMLVRVSSCIGNAISTRRKERKTNPREHWLDYAEEKHGKQLVSEIKTLFNVLVLYIPLPVFWALFDQQGSRWTFQATRMDGQVGALNLKPDQMQVINPALILIFIPLYDIVFYPLLAKIGIRRPLQKLTLGGCLAGVAFIISAILEIQLSKTYPIIAEAGESQLRIFNGMPCTYNVQTNIPDHANIVINSMEAFTERHIAVENTRSFTYTMSSTNAACSDLSFTGSFQLASGTAKSYFLRREGILEYTDDPEKASNGYPIVRVLANTEGVHSISFRDIHDEFNVRYENVTSQHGRNEIWPSTYDIYVNNNRVVEYELRLGGVYTLILREAQTNSFTTTLLEVSEPNSMNMLWIAPQYIVLTLGEVMYSVTGLEFSYSQSPESMKSVIQSAWQLTVGVGNVIVTIIASARIFNSQTAEFFLFAGLMFVDMGIFAILAYRYKYVGGVGDDKDTKKDDANETSNEKSVTLSSTNLKED